jgi:hypothetical protein
LEVAAEDSINLAAGKVRAGQQDLCADYASAFGTVGKLLLCGIVYRCGVDGADCGVEEDG